MDSGAKGIDVSNYQGNIDWNKVKASGIEFAIIRAGWGKSNVDPKFKQYIEGAIAAGLNIGIYWFLYAKNEADIIANANKCVSVIKPYKEHINMRVWSDWEYDSDNYFNPKSVTTRTNWVKRFCAQMNANGFEAGVYANPDYLKNKFDSSINDYPLWLAYYVSSKGNYNPYMWQYTSSGKVNGISGNVDLDIYYGKSIQSPKPKIDVSKYPVLKKGSRNNFVVKLQTELVNLGYDPNGIDGIFGNGCLAAVKKFQKDKGLVVDGMVGQKTWNALYNS